MYKKGTKAGEYDEVDVPPEYQERFERYSKELIERIAETDDTLLERYLGGEEIGRDEAIAAMKAGMLKGELGQTLIRGLGERHRESIVGPLAREFGAAAGDRQRGGEGRRGGAGGRPLNPKKE